MACSAESEMQIKGVIKKILYAGNGNTPEFEHGTKVTFHFQCRTLNADSISECLIDDSKKSDCPMELIIGKQFKMPVWEQCIKSMEIGEVAEFNVEKSLVTAYPLVSKSFRQFAGITKNDQRTHCCGMMALKDGFGQEDLDRLMHIPRDLQFTIELVKVEMPGEYEKESWVMSPEEKLQSIPALKEIGNTLYNNKKYKDASEKYSEALNRLEQLIIREKPGDDEWLELEKMKLPLLLNYSQCKLLEKDYYPVIECTTGVLERDPDNVKALYRRAKAHVGAWNLQLARDDYKKILELDLSLHNVVQKELSTLNLLQKQKDIEDKTKLCGKVFKS